MLHLEDRIGSLEKGKDADFVVLSGEPFSVYTQVLETYIDGERAFDRSQQKDWTYQTGGFALADAKRLPKMPSTEKPLPAGFIQQTSAKDVKFEGSTKDILTFSRAAFTRSAMAQSRTASF